MQVLAFVARMHTCTHMQVLAFVARMHAHMQVLAFQG